MNSRIGKATKESERGKQQAEYLQNVPFMEDSSISCSHRSLGMEEAKKIDSPAAKSSIKKLRSYSKYITHLRERVWKRKNQRANLIGNDDSQERKFKKKIQSRNVKHGRRKVRLSSNSIQPSIIDSTTVPNYSIPPIRERTLSYCTGSAIRLLLHSYSHRLTTAQIMYFSPGAIRFSPIIHG